MSRLHARTAKINTDWGPVHIGVSADESGHLGLVNFDHNDRLTDTQIGKLLRQLMDEINFLLKELRE